MSAIKLRDIISSLGNIICYCRQAFSLFLTKHEAKSRTIMDLAQEIDVKYKLFVISLHNNKKDFYHFFRVNHRTGPV